MENDRKSSYRKCSQTPRSTENTKYTKIVGKIEKKCRKGLDFKVYLNDTSDSRRKHEGGISRWKK